jgi:hypothetical protein
MNKLLAAGRFNRLTVGRCKWQAGNSAGGKAPATISSLPKAALIATKANRKKIRTMIFH